MPKTLVLIRHAHRDNSQREMDNGLDEKGRNQAEFIRLFFAERFATANFKKGIWFVSSPKLRCMETLLPTAKGLERQVDAHPDLDEQRAEEPSSSLDKRIVRFLDEWSRLPTELTVLCSHGDWLPRATFHLLGLAQAYKKGSWLELEWNLGSSQLRWYIPTFKPFYK